MRERREEGGGREGESERREEGGGREGESGGEGGEAGEGVKGVEGEVGEGEGLRVEGRSMATCLLPERFVLEGRGSISMLPRMIAALSSSYLR